MQPLPARSHGWQTVRGIRRLADNPSDELIPGQADGNQDNPEIMKLLL
jgi:hypothetical protein